MSDVTTKVGRPVFFEDVTLGMVIDFGRRTVSEAEILQFATQFDPQPYHVDRDAALSSPLKGLAASGWHTAALVMAMLVERNPWQGHPILGLGVDELRWPAPVRPGDTLALRGEVIALTQETARRGTVRVRLTLRNQDDLVVYSCIPIMVLPLRQRPA